MTHKNNTSKGLDKFSYLMLFCILVLFLALPDIKSEIGCIENEVMRECNIDGIKSLEVYGIRYQDNSGQWKSFSENVKIVRDGKNINLSVKDKFWVYLEVLPTYNGQVKTWQQVFSIYPDLTLDYKIYNAEERRIKFDINFSNNNEELPQEAGLQLNLIDSYGITYNDIEKVDDGLIFFNKFKFWIPQGCAEINKTSIKFINLSAYCLDPALILDGTTTTLGGNQSYDYVEIKNSGVLYIDSAIYWLNLTATYNITIDSTSMIEGAGRGRPPGSMGTSPPCTGIGPGNGTAGDGASEGGGGGAYGGDGGDGASGGGQGGNAYGTFNDTDIDIGSSGGARYNNPCYSLGGASGALLILNSPKIIISGVVNLSGLHGVSSGEDGAGGGGSGGGLRINSTSFLNISNANILGIGGAGGSIKGGGAGGGRVKIYHVTPIYNTSTTINVGGGAGGSGGGVAGDAGTIYYSPIGIETTLNFPPDNYATVNMTINFNCSAVTVGGPTLQNITLYGNWSGWHANETKNIIGTSNSTVFTKTFDTIPSFKWNCLAYDTTGVYSDWADVNWTLMEDTFAPIINIISPTYIIYNTSNISLDYTYIETNPDTCWYSLNNNTNTTIPNCLNTTILATKKTNGVYVCMNDTAGNEGCSATRNFDVGVFYFCDGSAYPSLNFTFKDEDTSAAVNGTLTLSSNYWITSQSISRDYDYGPSPVDYNATFCISPNWTSLSIKHNLTFSAAGYPQRKYFNMAAQTISNSTTTQNLYLLATANGIYTTFAVVSTGNQVIIGAWITLERQIGSNWIIVMQDKTDSAGTATFWVNPNYDYRITIAATGYASLTVTVRPTQTIYTVTMGGEAAGFVSADWIEGITYYIHPPSGILAPGIYNFSCIIRSTNENLEDCMFDLFYADSGISYANVTGCNSTGGTLILSDINFTQNTFGRVSVQINGSWYIIEADAHWVNISINVSGTVFTTIIDAIREAINMPEWGTDPQTADFSRIVFFFVIMAIILSVLNYYTGYDTAYPGTSIYIVFGLIAIFTFVNGIRGPGYFYLVGSSIHSGTFVGDIWNNMIVFFFALIIVISNALSVMRRQQ